MKKIDWFGYLAKRLIEKIVYCLNLVVLCVIVNEWLQETLRQAQGDYNNEIPRQTRNDKIVRSENYTETLRQAQKDRNHRRNVEL